MNKCIKCGKKGEFDTLCKKCFLKQNPILEGFKDISITLCVVCNKYLHKNKWITYLTIKIPIQQIVKDKLKINPTYKLENISVAPLLPKYKKGPGLKLDAEARVKIMASAPGYAELSEQYVIPVKLDFTYCKKCGKSGTDYFEAILQIRNPNNAAVDYVEAAIKAQSSRGVFSTKQKRTKSGIDYYMTEVKCTKTLATELQSKFGGELKISAKLHTRDKITSKEVYRVNAMLRLPDFKLGDIVLVDKIPIKITKMGKKIFGKNLLTDKQTSIDPKSRPKILDIHKTSVSKTYPALEVLHPETYQSIAVENPKKLKSSQKVKVVEANKQLFLV